MEYLLLVVGFILLTIAANWLVVGASGLAKRLNVPDLVIGLTVVAFGTSAPEMVVNLIAAYSGTNEIALTNVLGSNMINVLVGLGLAALIFPIAAKKSTRFVEIPLSALGAGMVLFLGTNYFGLVGGIPRISHMNGLVLLLCFTLFLIYTFRQARKGKNTEEEGFISMPIWKATILIIIGLVGLIIGGNMIVKYAVMIAQSWGVSEAIIGVTIVALGTSLPEIATAVSAALKKNADLAIGNVIGSNIFNIFLVLGTSSSICPLKIYPTFTVDALMATLSPLLVLVYILLNKKQQLNKWGGLLLLGVYACYLYFLLS